MKNFIKLGLIGVSLISIGCAKDLKISNNEQNKNYISAWVHKYHNGIKPSKSGLYTLNYQSGDGKIYNNEKYVYAEYEIRDLDSNIIETTNEQIAKQIDRYKTYNHYGDFVVFKSDKYATEGFWEMLQNMPEGSEKQSLIPSWLNIQPKYKKETDYYKHNSTNKNILLNLKIKKYIDNIDDWGYKNLDNYIKENNISDLNKMKDGIYFKYIVKNSNRTTPQNGNILRLNISVEDLTIKYLKQMF